MKQVPFAKVNLDGRPFENFRFNHSNLDDCITFSLGSSVFKYIEKIIFAITSFK